jgi:hypothetical protein
MDRYEPLQIPVRNDFLFSWGYTHKRQNWCFISTPTKTHSLLWFADHTEESPTPKADIDKGGSNVLLICGMSTERVAHTIIWDAHAQHLCRLRKSLPDDQPENYSNYLHHGVGLPDSHPAQALKEVS